MDGMTGTVDASAAIGSEGTTEKETPESSQQGTETVASENAEQAGREQSTTEGSPVNDRQVRQRGPSKLDTIKELRAKLRDRDTSYSSEIGSLRSQIEELKSLTQARTTEQKPRKTLWEDPDTYFDERLDPRFSALEKNILARLDQREVQNQQTVEWRQETSEATKFIESQKGINPEDHEDIADLISNTPAMRNLRPLDRAKYALFLWKEKHGISDRTDLKNRATTVVGAPQAPGGRKIWTKAEFDAKLDAFPKDHKHWTPGHKQQFEALEREIRDAEREGRVK